MEDLTQALALPDPDPELLPDTLPADVALEVSTASRILRAALREEAEAEVLADRMGEDIKAWQAMIAKKEQRAAAWRSGVAAWMRNNNVEKIQTPLFTASFTKARTKIVIDNEAAAITAVKTLGADKAVKVTERIVKAEFDALFQARPAIFEGAAHEETGEPSLVIRRKEAK
ncbi:MAG: hypothetical protein ABFD94_18880 [Armatimonadia bacterium]